MNPASFYRPGREIARGGMGAVLDARDQKFGRNVAMKVMLRRNASEEEQQRFLQEARVLGHLAHPNIVPIHDMGTDGQGRLFYTMKLVQGVTLHEVVGKLKAGDKETLARYPLNALLTVFQKVCDAVAFAHSRGIIHRDLKPQNIMVGEFGEVLVMDWGLAKILPGSAAEEEAAKTLPLRGQLGQTGPTGTLPLDAVVVENQATMASGQSAAEQATMASGGGTDEATLAPGSAHAGATKLSFGTHEPEPTAPSGVYATMEGAVMGTPHYMSPEQAEGRVSELDGRSDIFSLGGILYALLTLRPPVEGDSLEAILSKVRSATIDPPTTFNAPVSPPRAAQTNPDAASATQRIRTLSHCPSGKIPAALSAVTMKALQRDKAERYQTVTEFTTDLTAYQGGFATSAENATALTLLWLFIRRHRVAALGILAALVIGVTLGAKALAEGRRAQRALADLRETAPTFEAQAKALTGTGKLEDAIQKIGYAVKLAPENPDYRLMRANLLQAAQQLAEAAQDYRRVLALRPHDATARTNLELCETLLSENAGRAVLPPAMQSRLLDALLAQKRDLEAAPLATVLRRDAQAMRGGVLARLAHYTQQPGWKDARLTVLDGTFGLSLRGLQIGDLSVLQGLPFSSLEIAHTSFNDLRPLAGLPLSNLGIQWTTVSDLAPLRGMKLRRLDLYNTKVSNLEPLAGMPLEILSLGFLADLSDLSPLRGMPLKELNLDVSRKVVDLAPLAGAPIEVLILSRTALRDISVLRGMPLRELDLGGSDAITDFSPLERCATLERIKLPWDIRDLGFLRTLPKLKQVELHGPNEPDRWMAAPDFLAAHAADAPVLLAAQTALATLGATNLPVRRIALDKDQTLKLDLANLRISNLAALQHLPVKSLNLTATVVRDVTPLVEFAGLEAVTLPPNAQGIERLRSLPKLRHLSLRWNGPAQRPEQTAAEFWKEFDAKRIPGK